MLFVRRPHSCVLFGIVLVIVLEIFLVLVIVLVILIVLVSLADEMSSQHLGRHVVPPTLLGHRSSWNR